MEFGEISSTERRGQWNDFKSISTVKMETRHPVEVNLGSEFPAICNHCGVMAACSRKTWKNFWEIFCVFWKNDPSGYNFLKFCSGRFYLETDRRVVFKFREIWPTGNQWNRALFIWQKTKKIRLPLKLSLLRRSRPKSASASPDSILRVLQISSKSVHFSAEL